MDGIVGVPDSTVDVVKTSDRGRAFIELIEEGGIAKLRPYDDGTGTLTIGFGHTTAAGPPRVYAGMRITPELADEIFASDLHSVENNVNHLVKVPLTQPQFDTLVSFDFNTGGLRHSSALRVLNAGRYRDVPTRLALWNRGGGHLMRGLVKRRRAEAAMWFGDYDRAMQIARS